VAIRRQTRRVLDSPPALTADSPPKRLTVRLATQALGHLYCTTIHLRNNAHIINVLIDTGCLQANIISANIAKLPATDGSQIFGTNIVLTAGVGGQSYKESWTSHKVLGAEETSKHIYLRAIVCKDVTIELIIGLPLYYIITYSLSLKHIHIHGPAVKFVMNIISPAYTCQWNIFITTQDLMRYYTRLWTLLTNKNT
jgi:hypothetical protein